jgi:putative membrane protein
MMLPDPEKEEIKKLKKKLKEQEKKNTEIRDQMAVQRTIFANERTLMAYLRTAITIIAGGIAAIKLSNHIYMEIAGVSLLFIGITLSVYSFYRYKAKQRMIEHQRKDFAETSHHHAAIHRKQASRYGNTD